MRLETKKRFDKAYAKLSVKLKDKVDEALVIFVGNPFDHRLRNHALKGDYTGQRSIDVTGDVRIIFEEKNSYVEVILIELGKHAQLYK